MVRAVEPESLLALYDRALPQVYGYLVDRCGDIATAEDLTSETFLAAVAAAKRTGGAEVSMPWLIGVARHPRHSMSALTTCRAGEGVARPREGTPCAGSRSARR